MDHLIQSLGTKFLRFLPAILCFETSWAQTFTLTSEDFVNGSFIPMASACSTHSHVGLNVLPQLSWQNAPAGTNHFAIFMAYVTVELAEEALHWAVYGLNVSISSIAKGASPAGFTATSANMTGGTLAPNDLFVTSYGGPCPANGQNLDTHTYELTVFALSADIPVPTGVVTRSGFRKINRAVILDEATLSAEFSAPFPSNYGTVTVHDQVESDAGDFVISDSTADALVVAQTQAHISVEGPGETILESASGHFTVTLDAALDADLRLGFNFMGTAIFDEDYCIDTTRLVIPAGETRVTMNFDVHRDAMTEGEETIVFILTSVDSPGVTIADAMATAIIDDQLVVELTDSGAEFSSIQNSLTAGVKMQRTLSLATLDGLHRQFLGFNVNKSKLVIENSRRLYTPSREKSRDGYSLIDWFTMGLTQSILDKGVNGQGYFGYALVGAELSSKTNTVGGIVYGFEGSSWAYETETDVEKAGISVGIYGGRRLGPLHVSRSAIMTVLQNDFTNVNGFTAKAGSIRLMLTSSLSGIREFRDGSHLSPFINALYAVEDLDALTFEDGQTSEAKKIPVSRLGLGLEYMRESPWRSGQIFVRGELSQVFAIEDVVLSSDNSYVPTDSAVGSLVLRWVPPPSRDLQTGLEVAVLGLGNDKTEEIRLEGRWSRHF